MMHRRALTPMAVLGGLAVITVVIAGTAWMLSRREAPVARTDHYTARRGSFPVTIPASGELEALHSLEITNELQTSAAITFIAPEGSRVKAGDVVIRFDDKSTRDAIDDAEDEANLAEAAVIRAQADLDIQRQANASELTQADVDIRLAELALEAWKNGDHVSKLKSLELAVETSQKEYVRLVERYAASQDLFAQQFISKDDLQQDEIELMRASSALEQAKLALEVYQEYEVEKERAALQSALDQMRDLRKELVARHSSQIQSLEARLKSERHQNGSAQQRLAELREQLEKSTVIAPRAGLVVYWYDREDENPPDVGTVISRNRPVMILPDVSEMIAEVKVNEALSGRIRTGQTALVESDALPGIYMHGEIGSVSVLAESGGRRDPGRRDYVVRIRLLDAEAYDLKPNMRCKTIIEVDRVEDVLHVPVSAVEYTEDGAYVYERVSETYIRRAVTTGVRSDAYVEIDTGLDEGAVVALRPGT